MSKLPRLPAEVQLIIFEDTSLSTFDLIRLNATTSLWQKILFSKTYFQERLFLRPLGTFHPSPNFMGLDIKVTIRRIPYTIWNSVEKPLYEMAVRVELDPACQSVKDNTSLNPILRNLGHWMHIINSNFKHHERLETSYGHAIKPLPTLRFKDAQELRELLAPAHTAADADASWRKMLVSTVPVHGFDVHWSLLARFSARRSWYSGDRESHGLRTLGTDEDTTLGDHIEVFRDLLRELPIGELLRRARRGRVPWWWWW